MVSKDLTNNFFAILFIGPTASGKTALAHLIADKLKAHQISCELVNLDAFQIYKGVSAGTAKPTSKEIKKYKYHCIDILNPDENLDANCFALKATEACKSITARGNIPLCVGGSGLYLRSFLHGLDNLPPRNEEFRAKLKIIAEENGWPWCHKWLSEVDPIRAAELHPNDKTRIERALEIYTLLGKPMSSLRSKTNTIADQKTLFPCYVVQLEPQDSFLKEQIKKRVPLLFQQGWLMETSYLYETYGENLKQLHCMKAIGYKEILDFVSSQSINQNLHDAPDSLVERINTLTWQYAKKQGTWNAKEKKDFSVKLYNEEEFNLLFSSILKEISQFKT